MAPALRPCGSRRTLGQSTDRFFCAHPDIHAPRHIVSAAVCRQCPVGNAIPPDRFRSFPFSGATVSKPSQLHLVIAHYNEDLSWLEDFASLPRTIYTKSGTGPNRLPNVGREAHTYLHHIIENYDKLAEITVFLQGNPCDHVPDLFEKICSLDSATRYRELSELMLVDDAIGRPAQPGLPLSDFCKKLFGNEPPNYYCCRVGACFAVSRDLIRARSRDFYRHAMNLVLTEDRGPWSIERLWHLIFEPEPKTEGIVTAADAGFFRELQFLIRSLSAVSSTPICLIDLGLTESQRNWCLDNSNVLLWSLPVFYRPMRMIRERDWWQAWVKPYYLVQAPFDRVLWIDADCVVLKPLDAVFETLRKGPIFIRDGTDVNTENDPRLYDHLPLPVGAITQGVNVNSGVVGVCKKRDRRILSAWAWASQWLSMHPGLQPLSSWADQGLFLWAILNSGAADEIRSSLSLNQPVMQQPGLLAGAATAGTTAMAELQKRFPDAEILHFFGPYKLSRQMDDQLQEIFFVEKEFSRRG